ncbi:PAS domain S-box-containing protein [Pontibacter aydingkolensis]|uniref:histidine kinase n=1 Tax=Pontibacter aydingkolensis TaxID=1911536 RepID=A0ABS7CXW7_9BACT|nr:PAS domain-containing sensor histidine kinase [Pontibacter aydingkolensis]MBW7468662.1 PAS domain S-box protein [Pontibacter aydingkolensis]
MSLLTSDFYKQLLVNSTDLLSVIDETGVYKFVGDSVISILGYTPEELVGNSAFSYLHPDDVPATMALLEQASATDKIITPPFRFLSKHDGWRWIECTITNQLHNEAIKGYITNSRDITETLEERSKKDLHQAYYKSLFEAHPDAVFSLDKQGYFKSLNRQFSLILGFPEDVLLRAHFTEFIVKNDLSLVRTMFLNATEGTAQTLEFRVTDADNIVKVIHVTLLPVYLQGSVIGVQGIGKDITETLFAEQLVKERTEQLRKILESVTEPFIALDADWRYTFVNKAYCELIGDSFDFFNGQVIWQLYPDLLHSEFYQKCQKVAETGKTEYLEEVFIINGLVTLSFSIFPFDGGIAIHFVDVTAQSALKREMEKLSLVASKTINGVVIMDPTGKIEWVNDGFTRLSGYSRNEVVGLVPSMLLQGNATDPETESYIRQKYQEQVYFNAEVLNYRKSGEPYWVNIDVTPIKGPDEKLINYIAIQTDITEKKKAEAELVKLADDLYKQNLNLQQFTYMVSHNLRAPVANALGLTRLISKIDAGSPQFNSILNKLETSVYQLDTVIKDISNILSVRDAARTLPREMVNILAIVTDVLTPFEDELTSGNCLVTLDIDRSFGMMANKAYLYSILQNLVSNAIKYRSPDRALTLDISVKKDKRGFVYTISDNGLGMDMHVVENQLFKLYKRFHPSTHGKGIGLFLVKTQVETIGGKIMVDSAVGIGTTFKLLLGAKHVQ